MPDGMLVAKDPDAPFTPLNKLLHLHDHEERFRALNTEEVNTTTHQETHSCHLSCHR